MVESLVLSHRTSLRPRHETRAHEIWIIVHRGRREEHTQEGFLSKARERIAVNRMSLDENLKFEASPVLQSSGTNPLASTVPSRSGLQWIAVPIDCVGLFYRIEGGSKLQCIRATNGGSTEVLYSIAVPVPVVHLSTCDDGRLVCLACSDGSLHCYNATRDSFSQRWAILNAHSHVVSNLNDSPDRSRDWAASAAGPVRSLHFAPRSYTLLLADAGRQTLTFVQADCNSQPSPQVVDASSSYPVTCAAWVPNNQNNSESPLVAVGKTDGTIEICLFTANADNLLVRKTQLDAPVEEEDEEQGPWVCTHLEWLRGETLAAGYARVNPNEDEDEEEEDADDEEENDDAEHEASFYIITLSSDYAETSRTSLGDVVAFFSVPRNGRHVFYSGCTPTKEGTPLLLVASNVSSDVAVIAHEDEEFRIIDIPEGDNAAAPTDADDEFTFPVGIGVVGSVDGPLLVLSATDGSLSTWRLGVKGNEDFFTLPTESLTELSVDPVETSAPDKIPLVSERESTPPDTGVEQSTPTVNPPAFGASTSVAFGSGTKAPSFSFGSPSFSFGSSFGTGSTSTESNAPVFGGTSSLGASSKPVFGVTSMLGSGKTAPTESSGGSSPDGKPASTSIFGSGSKGPVFGANTSMGSGGFGNLANASSDGKPSEATTSIFGAGTKAPIFGSGSSPALGFGSLASTNASSPGKPTEATTSIFGSGSKTPIFGDASASSSGFGGLSSSSPFNAFSGSSPSKVSAAASFAKPLFGTPSAANENPSTTKQVPTRNDREVDAQGQPSDPNPNAEKAAMAFDLADPQKEGKLPVSKLADILDDLGEGFHGEELDALVALIDEKKTGSLDRKAFIDWYVMLSGDTEPRVTKGGDIDLHSEEEEEWKEQMELVKTLFGELGHAGATNLVETKFPELVNGLGSTYCEDGEHGRAKTRLAENGVISLAKFLEWYKRYLFGDDEEHYDEAEEDKPLSPTGTSPTQNLSPERQKASRVFELFVEGDIRKIPVTKLSDILDELGEGFYGEELDKQIALMDPNQTGFLEKEAFVNWYVELSEKSGRSRDGNELELDSEEEDEWNEQVELVQTVFKEMGEKGGLLLGEDKFPELVESLGSTYCEDGDHGRAKKKLTKNGMIPYAGFLEWYKNYLFGDDEESYAEEEQKEEEEKPSSLPEEKARPIANWGDTFKTEEGSWKCEVCSVLNKASQLQCGACEAAKPGCAPQKDEKEDTGKGVGSSIGSSGFTFGAAPSKSAETSSIGYSGFTFGGTAPSFGTNASSTESSVASSGFTFGGTAEPFGVKDNSKGVSVGSAGFTFGATASSGYNAATDDGKNDTSQAPSAGSSGFTFGTTSSGKSSRDSVESDKNTGPSPLEPVLGTKAITGKVDDGTGSALTHNPRPEGQRATRVFELFVKGGTRKIPVTKLSDILDELGEGFHGGELDKQIALMDPNQTGFLEKEAFVNWYVELSEKAGRSRDGNELELDSEEEDEWNEQVELVQTVFKEMGEKGGLLLGEDKFPELVESLGSTYCEEGDHGRAKKKLTKNGMISYEGFLEWYKNYLFGDDEESYTEEEQEEEEEKPSSLPEGKARPIANWGDTFKTEEGSWKCEVGSVLNKASQLQCGACEAAKPGCAPQKDEKEDTGKGVGSSIGSSGFTFGAAPSKSAETSSIGSSGFTFGGTAPSFGTNASSVGASGFTFGSNVPSISSGAKVIGSSGFTFGSSNVSTVGAESSSGSTPASVATKTSSSSAYPPTPSKAPTAFGAGCTTGIGASVSSTSPKVSATTGYPPTPSKAPAKFGAGSTATAVPIKVSSSSAYPPMPAKAPKPCATGSTSASAATKTSSSSAYPPTPSKAPTVFGAGSTTGIGASVLSTSPKVSATTGYPPTPSKAPTKFGTGSTATAVPIKVSSSSAYPPMPAKAPKPFSTGSTSASAATKTSSSSAYPPTPSKAPTVFGAGSTTGIGASVLSTSPKVSATTGYPPTPSKAPTKFEAGSTATTVPIKVSSSSAYPPMPAKAPKAFGTGSTADSAATKSSTSSAYPPTPSNAPSPFGAGATASSSTKAFSSSAYPTSPSKALTASSFSGGSTGAAVSTKISSASAYPPLPTKAPTSFGWGSASGSTPSAVPAKTSSSSASAPTNTSSSVYPPVPTKSPTPFGTGSTAGFSSTQTSLSPAYPPAPLKAPTPFGSGNNVSGATTIRESSSVGYPPAPSQAPTPYSIPKPASGSSLKPNQSSAGLTSPTLSKGYPPTPSKAPSPFGKATISKTSSSSGYPPTPATAPTPFSSTSSSSHLSTTRSQRASSQLNSSPSRSNALGDKTIPETTMRYINIITQMERSLALVYQSRSSNNDDRETEERILEMSKCRSRLFSSIADAQALVVEVGKRVPQFAGLKPTIDSRVEQAHAILKERNSDSQTELFDSQPLDMESEKIQRHLSLEGMRFLQNERILQQRCHVWRDLVHGNVKEMTEVLLGMHERVRQLEQASRKMKKAALDLDTLCALRPQSQSLQLVQRNEKQIMTKDESWKAWSELDSSSFQSIVAPSRMAFELRRVKKANAPPSPQLKSRQVKNPIRSSFRSHEGPSEAQDQNLSPFSPSQSVTPRGAWDKASTADQSRAKRMVFTSPRELRETSLGTEAPTVLRAYGTSLESIQGSQQREDPVVNKAFQPSDDRYTESRHERNVLSSQKESELAELSTSSASPGRILERQDGNSTMTNRAKRLSPGQLEKDSSYTNNTKSTASGLDGMAGLGLSLSSEGKRGDRENEGSPGLLGVSLISPKQTTSEDQENSPETPDYHTILTQFYEKHNPSKLNSVAATLKKYQVRYVMIKIVLIFRRLNFGLTGARAGYVCEARSEIWYVLLLNPLMAYDNLLTFTFYAAVASPLDNLHDPGRKGVGAASPKPPIVTSNPSLSTIAKPIQVPSPFASQKDDQSSAPVFGTAPVQTSQPSFGAKATSQQSGGFSFGSSTSAPTPFTQPLSSPAPWTPPSANGGSPREMLTKFYEQRNPSKLGEVDKVLAKYAGKVRLPHFSPHSIFLQCHCPLTFIGIHGIAGGTAIPKSCEEIQP